MRNPNSVGLDRAGFRFCMRFDMSDAAGAKLHALAGYQKHDRFAQLFYESIFHRLAAAHLDCNPVPADTMLSVATLLDSTASVIGLTPSS